jgi:putative phosphoesterase
MKIQFISDVHGSSGNLEAALEAGRREGAEMIAFLGDALYHGPRNPLPQDYDPAGTAAVLNRWRDRILAVRGNCDSEVDQLMLTFPVLADYAWLLAGQRRIFLTHGHRYDPDRLPPLSPGDLFVFGHSHIPLAERRGDFWVFNPGSVGLPKDGCPPSYGILSQDQMVVKDLAGDTLLTCRLAL